MSTLYLTNTQFDFYSTSSLKQSMSRHVAPLWHTIQILIQLLIHSDTLSRSWYNCCSPLTHYPDPDTTVAPLWHTIQILIQLLLHSDTLSRSWYNCCSTLTHYPDPDTTVAPLWHIIQILIQLLLHSWHIIQILIQLLLHSDTLSRSWYKCCSTLTHYPDPDTTVAPLWHTIQILIQLVFALTLLSFMLYIREATNTYFIAFGSNPWSTIHEANMLTFTKL
jgi:hypothetical protein